MIPNKKRMTLPPCNLLIPSPHAVGEGQGENSISQ